MTPFDYKNKVTQLENGTYCWRCEVDDDTSSFAYKLTFGVCGGTCAVLILMSFIMGDLWAMKITLFSSLAVMASSKNWETGTNFTG